MHIAIYLVLGLLGSWSFMEGLTAYGNASSVMHQQYAIACLTIFSICVAACGIVATIRSHGAFLPQQEAAQAAGNNTEKAPKLETVPPGPTPRNMRPCPHCGQNIGRIQQKCLHCGQAVEPLD